MCGRYSVLTEDEIIETREILQDLSLRIVKDEFEEYDDGADDDSHSNEIRPANHAPVIIKDSEGVSFENLKWGFKKFKGSGVIINARSETIKVKGTFSRYLEGGRCVVPAGEFFEWHRIGKNKIKHYVKDKNGNLLFMAGLYRNAPSDVKSTIEKEFVIITKEATDEMRKIHDRMPVILRTDQIEEWLNGKLSPDDLEKLDYDVTITPCEDKKKE